MKGVDLQKAVQELQSLDPKNPGAWPDWVRYGAAILLIIAMAGGGYWFIIKPKQEELAGLQRQEQTLRRDFETKQRRAASLDAYKTQLAEMERSFGEMLRQLPGRAEVANLLNDISQTRVASNLEEELFQPQTEIKREFYAELPNRIVIVGDFHDMGAFVSGVSALPRIVTIDSVEIVPAGGSGARAARGRTTGGAPTQLRMTAVAKTYRYLDDEELEAQRPRQQPARRRR
jgi:type IV pilus assembly protein PilO